jgi:hypothetical protein
MPINSFPNNELIGKQNPPTKPTLQKYGMDDFREIRTVTITNKPHSLMHQEHPYQTIRKRIGYYTAGY